MHLKQIIKTHNALDAFLNAACKAIKSQIIFSQRSCPLHIYIRRGSTGATGKNEGDHM